MIRGQKRLMAWLRKLFTTSSKPWKVKMAPFEFSTELHYLSFSQLIRIKYHDQLLKIMDFVSQVRKNLEGKLRIVDGQLIGKGIVTVCAFSSLLYAAVKCIQFSSEIEVVRD